MGNRKLPFGYKIVLGKITIEQEESKIVKKLYQGYNAGNSLKDLTDKLQQQTVIYENGKVWNKNMVSRILQDTRYLGNTGYPPIITEMQFQRAKEKRAKKSCPVQKSEVQRALRRLFGSPVSEEAERSIADLLNSLAKKTEQIQAKSQKANTAICRRQAELKSELEQQSVDEAKVRALIFRLAAEQYEALENQEYETARLRRLFSGIHCVVELNADLLKNTVSEVIVTHKKVGLKLKNGQIIERNELE